MARRRILAIGGVRSGKNRFAMEIAKEISLPVVYVATGMATDTEMTERIERHRQERPGSWTCIEEPLNIAESIASIEMTSFIIVDCLTFWTNNLIYLQQADESYCLDELRRVLQAIDSGEHSCIIISNDVGSGVVPEHESGRVFRDIIGVVNQDTARWADEVYQTFAGLNRRWK